MEYTKIFFRAWDSWGAPLYDFQLNMSTRVLYVKYSDADEGLIERDVILHESQYKRLRVLASPERIEPFRGIEWTKTNILLLEPNDWQVQFVCDDGTPPLFLEIEAEACLAPPPLLSLTRYVTKIGTCNKRKWRLF